ncbi:MAG: DUF4159 domain-containing protein [Planctomycetes bacterium]|nr:DUF4159 domain-containing protein [Planctomycetota bacterium]
MTNHTPENSSGSKWIVVCLIFLMLPLSAMAAERQLGTIGPPPKKSPQRQTSAEGFPPLPLPAVPLRRSEPKHEPGPPVFAAKLTYGTTQDYMPNPADLDTLLRHVRYQLDIWYGHTILKIDELVAMYKAGKKCEIPLLHITGYQKFEFTPEQRTALREYLLDGGTLLGDAALGSPEFADSFRAELAAIFPKRKLDILQLDHPIFRGYYPYQNVHYFTIAEGVRSKLESPPQFLGLRIAARTAVILTPYDMTCGWDEFYAPAAPRRGNARPAATRAMMPADAIRMGINLIAYVSAERNFAKTQAYTRKVEGTQAQRRAAVRLGLLRHQGDWNPDAGSIYQLIRLAALRTSIPIAYELKSVDAEIQQLTDTPLLIMTGMDEPRLTAEHIAALQRHLQAGGFLFINNTSGFAKFDREARALIPRLLPEHKLQPVPAEHGLYHALYDIDQVRHAATRLPRKPDLHAVFIGQRAVVVYSPTDTLGMIKGIHDPYANAYDAESARRLALNILCYALGQ